MTKRPTKKHRRDPADDGLKPGETPKEIMVAMTKDTYEFARRYAREHNWPMPEVVVDLTL